MSKKNQHSLLSLFIYNVTIISQTKRLSCPKMSFGTYLKSVTSIIKLK